VTLELDACELVVVEGRVDRIEAGTVAAKGELRTASRTILSHEPTALDLRKLFVVEDPDPATTGTPVRQW